MIHTNNIHFHLFLFKNHSFLIQFHLLSFTITLISFKQRRNSESSPASAHRRRLNTTRSTTRWFGTCAWIYSERSGVCGQSGVFGEGFWDFGCVLLCFIVFYCILLIFIDFYCILLIFIVFYCILLYFIDF